MTLLGKSHHGRSEAEDTLTIISHGVESSIAGGRGDETDGREEAAKAPFVMFP